VVSFPKVSPQNPVYANAVGYKKLISSSHETLHLKRQFHKWIITDVAKDLSDFTFGVMQSKKSWLVLLAREYKGITVFRKVGDCLSVDSEKFKKFKKNYFNNIGT